MKTIWRSWSRRAIANTVKRVAHAQGVPAAPDVVIEARGVGLRYRIRDERTTSFQLYLFNLLRGRTSHRDFWPLVDVSLTVRRGEIHGLIGSNGQGKTTLLRLLAGIYQPDRGTLATRGRVSPLLTLGAGFNQELTGRENIFLNAILLGQSRPQVEANLQRIIAFADLGPFIDQPIRTYSSGMTARLGFAIGIHVEPDVLLLDEVMGVGDEAFKAKCKKAMLDMVGRAGTVVLVSHSLGLVNRLCTTASWLQGGRIQMSGKTREVTAAYRNHIARTAEPEACT